MVAQLLKQNVVAVAINVNILNITLKKICLKLKIGLKKINIKKAIKTNIRKNLKFLYFFYIFEQIKILKSEFRKYENKKNKRLAPTRYSI